jgi:hypothetical protein
MTQIQSAPIETSDAALTLARAEFVAEVRKRYPYMVIDSDLGAGRRTGKQALELMWIGFKMAKGLA